MARIMIENLSKKALEVRDLTKTLLQHFHDHQVDWMQACGAKGRCTTCKVIIKEGHDNFQPPTKAEQIYSQQGALNSLERLACQAKITGNVIINAPKEYQLPHLRYSDEE
jgi:2Fe-2S ferredoxin